MSAFFKAVNPLALVSCLQQYHSCGAVLVLSRKKNRDRYLTFNTNELLCHVRLKFMCMEKIGDVVDCVDLLVFNNWF